MSKPAFETAVLPRPGDVVANKYSVEATIGSGAMGVVFRALHIELGQRVAIKFLRPEAAKDSAAVARFVREARAAATIQSEHVVRVFDVARLENGTPYLVMEHLAGTDLHKLSCRRGNMPVTEMIEYMLQTCQALAEVHAAGITHRDLKPGNLFVARRSDGSPLVKVLDFGISKIGIERNGGMPPPESLTSDGQIVGSIHYMSPEQLKNAKHVDGRSDIWALGAIMYKLLTGRYPFEGATIASCIQAILNGALPPLGALRADVPPEVERVIALCLEKDPGERFQNVAELADALMLLGPSSTGRSIERIRGVLIGSDTITDSTRNFDSFGSLVSESELSPVSSGGARPHVGVAPASAVERTDTATADLSVAALNQLPALRSPSTRSRRTLFMAAGGAAALAIGIVTAMRLLPSVDLATKSGVPALTVAEALLQQASPAPGSVPAPGPSDVAPGPLSAEIAPQSPPLAPPQSPPLAPPQSPPLAPPQSPLLAPPLALLAGDEPPAPQASASAAPAAPVAATTSAPRPPNLSSVPRSATARPTSLWAKPAPSKAIRGVRRKAPAPLTQPSRRRPQG